MSDNFIDVLTDEYEDEFTYQMERLITLFNGQLREWSLWYNHFGFTKRFGVKSAVEIVTQSKKNGLGLGIPFELHFTLCCYQKLRLPPENAPYPNDWNFVIDVDIDDFEERKNACMKICSLLSKVGVYYLVDSRYHIWFPPWEKIFIDDWASLYGQEEFAYGIKYYLEKMCDLPDCIDDYNFKTARKLFRVPFTPHLKSGQPMSFISPRTSTIEEFTLEWTGKNYPTETLEDYAKKFQRFLYHAYHHGYQFYQMLQEELNNSKSNELFESPGSFKWVEKLLNVPIPKGKRDAVLWRVIMPYFVNIKKFGKAETVQSIHQWLQIRCGADSRKDRNLFIFPLKQYDIVRNNGNIPPRLEKFKQEHPLIYGLLLK